MATINFSIPDDLKREFQETFRGENKSALIADLMRQALEDRKRRRRRARAVDALLDFRRRQEPLGDDEIAAAREEIRP
jgi:metal-responsive CopG/Arc/MetJ family transcriptional regulator